ncbi:hypothetical protein Salat_0839500 [Sesamum alatum]|uniref:BED-type domain-containing protein n=1 Tax=Sesamum alatum TaxID=300844 RepID=A0AAE1YIR2_9LAMI|nr:hypothetical protein Salat_0839500 [Sesamum alatum]
MQSEEETLEQTTNATNEERIIGPEENVEATKDDNTLGSKPKCKKKSTVSQDFIKMKDADGVMKISCIHCKRMYTKSKTVATTQLHRHLQSGMTRNTAKACCINVYELEKKKLKCLLKKVNKISLTTDCWKSKNQKIEYMVITGHWTDESWQLQKRVRNFVHILPPRRGLEIANAIWRCLEDWALRVRSTPYLWIMLLPMIQLLAI